jgi:hypothetical protein
LQSWLLRRLPPLSNDRVFRWSVGLLLAQAACASAGLLGTHPAVAIALAGVGLILLVATHGVVLLLTFAGDALPTEYARLVNIRERLHPITMAALAYVLLSHVTAFATGYAALEQLNRNTWADQMLHSYFALWFFSYLTTFTIAFGDLQPASAAVKILVVFQVAASATMLFGMVAVIVSSYVGALSGRRELLLNLRAGEASLGGGQHPEGGDQPSGGHDDMTDQPRGQPVGRLAAEKPVPDTSADNPSRSPVEHDTNRVHGEMPGEHRPVLPDHG